MNKFFPNYYANDFEEIKKELEEAGALKPNDNGIRIYKIGNKELSGVEARKVFNLKSAKFDVSINGDLIKFSVNGYGHGVGLSQCGSDSLAKQGKNYAEIIKYYYKDVEISE